MKTINETNYVDKAEKAIRSLRDKAEQQRKGRGELKIVTTSKKKESFGNDSGYL